MTDINALIAALRRPNLYERSAAPFWDDDHISREMLTAHLDPNTDAASRRPEIIDRSAAWLATLLPAGGRVLDLGCGPGLYASRLAAAGFAVTGVDVSRRSIEYARTKDGKSKYVCGNYLDLDLGGEYDAVILIYCDYAALTEDERRILLSKVYGALKRGGLFIFDVFTPAHAPARESTAWSAHANGGFFSHEPHVLLEATRVYGAASADVYAVVTDGGVTEHIVWDTRFTPDELSAEVGRAGFGVRGLFGDVCGAPYDEGSATLCIVCERLIETERLYLRRMCPADYPALARIMQDDEVMYAYEGAFSDEETADWLARQLERYGSDGVGLWAAVLKSTGEMIGQCGLTYQPWKDDAYVEVGYLFAKAYWHNGYAAEAARAARDYAFSALGVSSVCSIIRDTNAASQRVAIRNGMTPADTWTKRYRGVDMPHILFLATKGNGF